MPTTRHTFDRWLAGETVGDIDYAAAPVDDAEPEPYYCRTCDTETLDRLGHAHDETRTRNVGNLRLTHPRTGDLYTIVPGVVTVPVGSDFDGFAQAVLDLLVDRLNAAESIPVMAVPVVGRSIPATLNVRGRWFASARPIGGVSSAFVRYDAILTARRRRPIRCRFTVRAADVKAVAR